MHFSSATHFKASLDVCVVVFLHMVPVFMCPSADILHSCKTTRHPGVGIELFHYRLSHSEVVGVTSGLQNQNIILTL